MFIDQVIIEVHAGRGGNGSNAMRQLRTKHKRIPDGGAGGRGGDVLLVADENTRTLLDLNMHRFYKASPGQHGSSNRRRGRSGAPLEIRVPIGSVVIDKEKGFILRDLRTEGSRLVVARGGHAGKANAKNRKKAEPGGSGERRVLKIELKLIADAGIVGFPNSGKTTLLNALSGTKAKVADYPFSTLEPGLGMIEDPNTYERATLCDVPGLIEGARHGRGIGNQFLKHIERTRILVHLVEMVTLNGLTPLDRYHKINEELAGRDARLARKRQIVVASKMDVAGAQAELKRFRSELGSVVSISVHAGQGLQALKEKIIQTVHSADGEAL